MAGSHLMVPWAMTVTWITCPQVCFRVLKPAHGDHRATGAVPWSGCPLHLVKDQCPGKKHGHGNPAFAFRKPMETLGASYFW